MAHFTKYKSTCLVNGINVITTKYACVKCGAVMNKKEVVKHVCDKKTK